MELCALVRSIEPDAPPPLRETAPFVVARDKVPLEPTFTSNPAFPSPAMDPNVLI